jgi:hypothetical protein
MKKFTLLLCALTIITITSQAQRIRGEGDVVKQEIQLERITGISLSFAGDVVLTYGSPQEIIVEAQQNIIDNIKREVKNGSWQIAYQKNVRDAKKVTVYITMETLEDAAVSGSGSITSTNRFEDLDDVELAVSGSGEIDLELSAEEIEVAISGSGDMELSGTGESLEIAISGSGDVDAGDLVVEDCEIAISGSGDATVHVNGSLEAAIAGSGDVRYRGNATKVQSSVSGSGDVESID